MALNDIEKRITREAEAEAKKVILAAEKEKEHKLKQARDDLAIQQEELKAKIKKNVEQAVEQQRMLSKLEAGQNVLAAKRAYLKKVQDGVEREILDSESLLEKYFSKILGKVLSAYSEADKLALEVSVMNEKALKKVVKAIGSDVNVSAKKSLGPGRLALVQGRSRMDLSLQTYLKEELKAKEAELAANLF